MLDDELDRKKLCENCERPSIKGERFCRNHRNRLMREMKRSGYLTKPPRTKWSTETPIPAVIDEDTVVLAIF